MRTQCRWRGTAAGRKESHPAPYPGCTRARNARSRAHRLALSGPILSCGRSLTSTHEEYSCTSGGTLYTAHTSLTTPPGGDGCGGALRACACTRAFGRGGDQFSFPSTPRAEPWTRWPAGVRVVHIRVCSLGRAGASLPPDSRVEKKRAGKGRALEKNAPRQGVARIEGPGEVLRRERMRFRGASRRG